MTKIKLLLASMLLVCSFYLSPIKVNAQITSSQQWTWVGGDSTTNKYGVYGTQGTAAVANKPGTRQASISWSDAGGNLWLFGGQGYAASSFPSNLNDLWKYNTNTGQWTWVSGDNTTNKNGVYGTQGTAAAANKPGARYTNSSWTDTSGNLWLFGGNGLAASGGSGYLNDLWKYNTTTGQWIWVSGDNTINQNGVYGTKGTAASNNKPGARYTSSIWKDASGNLWLFGGQGLAASGGTDNVLNDLWKYNTTTGQWTWVSGDSTTNKNGVYGTQGTAAAANKPGARQRSYTWTDASGNLWLFGGQGLAASGFAADYLNDLWKYNTTTGQWTWMSGDSTVRQNGVYGTQGNAAAANKPGTRQGSNTWTDASGNLWLFGGNGLAASGGSVNVLNDLWKYNTNTGQWTWVSGDSITSQRGVYGTQGNAAAANKPGARQGSNTWTDASGNLWLMGGFGFAASGGFGYLNDLWKISTCTPTTATVTVTAKGSYAWHGTTYTSSGSYTFDTTNVGGCDSLTTLKLTINACTATYNSVAITASGSYTWHGTTYAASITKAIFDTVNSIGCDSITLLNLTIIPISTWTGTVSTDWFNTGNWSNGVPDTTTDVIIPSGTLNSPTIGSGTAVARNITIATGATLTNNATLNLYGKLNNNGTFTNGKGSNVELKGALTLNGKTTFDILTVDATYGLGGSTADMVSITSILKKKTGLLVTSNKLTLVSNADGTGMIEEAGGTLFGKAYIQHYAGGNFGYHHFSSPVSGATVNSWSNAFPITGPDGAPSWLSNWGSLQYYDEPANTTSLLDSGYYNYTALSNSLVSGQGYTAWLNSLPTLNTFGTPNNGAISLPVTHTAGTNDPKGWNMVGNPYPSPISWTALKAKNPGLFGDASCYLWKASGTGTDGTWTAYDGTVGVNGAGDVINSSLGFFVYVNNSGTLNFDNSVRVYDYTSPEIFGTKSNATNTLRLSIKDAVANTNDEAVAYTGYQTGFSRKMVQPAGATNATIAFDVKGTKAAINVLTAIDSKTELPITLLTPNAGTYTLSLSTKNINLPVYLKDGVTGTYTDLSAATTITTTAKETIGRYSLVFKQSTVDRLPFTVYPNPSKNNIVLNGNHIASVQVVDNLGRVVKTVSLKDAINPTLTLSGLSAGAYHLKVQTTDGKVSNVAVVKE